VLGTPEACYESAAAHRIHWNAFVLLENADPTGGGTHSDGFRDPLERHRFIWAEQEVPQGEGR
jgi:hypothetical protein